MIIIKELIDLQLTMFLMMGLGWLIKKFNLVDSEGQKNLTDLVIYVVLPCNIIKSFMVEFSFSIMYSFLTILCISIMIQLLSTILGRVLYYKIDSSKRKCLQYATICSNAGFLGNPVAEGIFGTMGLTLASIYLIPQRIVMWSAGISIFTESPSKKYLFKKVITHPCIIGCIFGIFLMISQISLPSFLAASIISVSNCNTALSMIIIGMILTEVDLKEMIDKTVIYFTVIRLIIIPVLVYIPCVYFSVDPLVTGVSVVLAAMPAGATTSILAAKYNGDALFATGCVVFTTLVSFVTTTLWSMLLV